MKAKISVTVDESLLKAIEGMVDGSGIRNRSQAIESVIRNALGKNKTAVLLAGGSPQSLKVSDGEYRPTARVGASTVVEEAISALHGGGFRTIYIIGRKDILTSIFSLLKNGSECGVAINYIEEQQAKGTYDSLRLLKGKVHSPFLVAYCDIMLGSISLNEIWTSHMREKAVATLLLTTSPLASEKGTVLMEGSKVVEFAQKPKKTSTYLVFSSLFVAEPDIFDYKGSSLEYDLFPMLARKELLRGHVSSESVYHVHTKEDAEKWKQRL